MGASSVESWFEYRGDTPSLKCSEAAYTDSFSHLISKSTVTDGGDGQSGFSYTNVGAC